MVNSSPEYAITKSGMHTELRKRAKPLRTYGRQNSTPEARGEPPAKRLKPDSKEEATKLVTNGTVGLQKPSAKPTATTTRYGNKPGDLESKAPTSILNYFKPIPAAPKSPSMENRHPDSQTSPPRSPTVPPRTKRKPRLLRIRPANLPSGDKAEDRSDTTSDAAGTESTELDDTDGWCTGRRTRSQATGANERQPLDDHNDSIGNEQRRHPSDAISAQPERRRSARRKVQPTVQTTLNISSRAAFSECRICDTVWNPMYPDDVKYHVKRHQAVVRAKRKREDSIL